MTFTYGDIDYVISLREVYDGWSIAVLKDGTVWNRWQNADGDGPTPGYEHRYQATQEYIEKNLKGN